MLSSRSTTAIVVLHENWAIVLIVLICGWLLSNYYKRRLDRIPGPTLRSLWTLPRVWSVYNGFSHEDDLALHRKYGKIVRLAPNLLSVSDPNEINPLYGAGTKFRKSAFYALVEAYDEEGIVPDPFVLRDREEHARAKRSASNAYSMAALVQLEPCIDPVTDRLVKKFEGYAKSGKSVDISVLMQEYAMDAIFSLTFGKDFNHMDAGDHMGLFKTMQVVNDYMAVFGQFAWSHNFLLKNTLMQRIFLSAAVDGNNKMIELAKSEMVVARQEVNSDQVPMMTFLQRLILNQKQNPKSLTDRELSTHAFNNISAGSDTTATALRSIIYNILMSPEAHEKLKEEVRGAGLTHPVSFAAANKLPYLSAVIREGIRMHPSVGMLLARVVPEGGATVCGYYLRPGTELGVNPWVSHRDPEVYPDPDQFYPERWLPSHTSEEQLRRMNRSFIPFGHGAHTCSGRWISTMEMQKVISTMFLLFDMELGDSGKGFKYHNLWFTPQKGLNVMFKMVEA